jgi:serine/threonine protein kinase
MSGRLEQQLGNYVLIRQLGTGGFASVYLGQHVRIPSMQAAIKILHLGDVNEQQFQQEAETTARLVHPHIVRLLDFDVQQGTPFLVLEYAPGGSLRTRYPKGSQVPIDTVIGYLGEIVPALQHAHEQHILHRDIKPDNILIGRQGELLLSDFGIAVLSQTGKTSIQGPTGSGGTPYYMAPEQFRGRPSKASDQYALAVVVYEWLSGTVPFSEGGWIEIGFQHLQEPVPPLCERGSLISTEIEHVVMTALAKDPEQRFESISAFADALSRAVGRQAVPPIVYEQQPPNHFLPTSFLSSSPEQVLAPSSESDVPIHSQSSRTESVMQTTDTPVSDQIEVPSSPDIVIEESYDSSDQISSTGLEPRHAAALSYLGLCLTGLLIFRMERKSRLVRFSAAQSALLFFPLILVCIVLQWIIGIFSGVPVLGSVVAFFLNVVTYLVIVVPGGILWLHLTFQAYQGIEVKLPFVGEYAEKIVHWFEETGW